MDTWNAVRSGTIKYDRCVIADRLWGLLAPKPLGFNPLRKGADAGWKRLRNAKRLLTPNSLFMDTRLAGSQGVSPGKRYYARRPAGTLAATERHELSVCATEDGHTSKTSGSTRWRNRICPCGTGESPRAESLTSVAAPYGRVAPWNRASRTDPAARLGMLTRTPTWSLPGCAFE